MLYIKQIILRVITEMDLNECAEIKKNIQKENNRSIRSIQVVLFSFYLFDKH